LIQVQGYSTAAGAAFLPLIMIMFLLALVGGLVNRYGAKLPLMGQPSLRLDSLCLPAGLAAVTGPFFD